MDFDEYDAVTKPPAPPTIGVGDLHGPDRTLLYGYTTDRETFHVYLLDGEIHRYTYVGGRDGRWVLSVSYSVGHYAVASDLVPDKRVYPAATDAEFARLLLAKGATIPWTNFDQGQHERAAEVAFYGAVYEADRSAPKPYDSSTDRGYNPHQHCTVDACTFAGMSHTATYCGTSQPRRCGCAFCYPTDARPERPTSTVPEGSHGSDWSGASVSDGGWTGRQI